MQKIFAFDPFGAGCAEDAQPTISPGGGWTPFSPPWVGRWGLSPREISAVCCPSGERRPRDYRLATIGTLRRSQCGVTVAEV